LRRSILAVGLLAALGALMVSVPPIRHASARVLSRAFAVPAEELPPFHEDVAPTPGGFSGRTFTERGVVHRYQIFFPRDYTPARRWPVVVALHGSAEKGDDGVRQLEAGLGPVVRERAGSFPAVVVFPQIPAREKVVTSVPMLSHLIDTVLTQVNGDPDRVYLTGFSLGGMLTYVLADLTPGRFAAIVPVAAPIIISRPDSTDRLSPPEARARISAALQRTPAWIVHGAQDSAVAVTGTRELVAALQADGRALVYTELPDAGHDSWDRAYRTDSLWAWLFAQHR
jgi:predicted peptidase